MIKIPARFWTAFVLIAVTHLIANWLAFTKSAAIRETSSTLIWRAVSEWLAFPIVYLSRWLEGADVVMPLVVLNSMFWSASIVALAWLVTRNKGATD